MSYSYISYYSYIYVLAILHNYIASLKFQIEDLDLTAVVNTSQYLFYSVVLILLLLIIL